MKSDFDGANNMLKTSSLKTKAAIAQSNHIAKQRKTTFLKTSTCSQKVIFSSLFVLFFFFDIYNIIIIIALRT